MAVTGKLVGDEMRQLCGRSKEYHRFFDDDSVGSVGRGVLLGLVVSGIDLWAMFEAGARYITIVYR